MVQPTPLHPDRAPIGRRYESYKGTDAGPHFYIDDERFDCVPVPAGETLARLASSLYVNDRGQEGWNLPNLVQFIEDVLVEETRVETPVDDTRTQEQIDSGIQPAPPQVTYEPTDDVARFRIRMRNKRNPVGFDVLGEIVGDLSKWYNERPTRPSGS